jgi:very-short-patch-repair endonuclease
VGEADGRGDRVDAEHPRSRTPPQHDRRREKLRFLLRKKKLEDFRFRRQAAIGPYIADFFCASAKFIVELDGSPHSDEEQVHKDAARTKWLEARGCRVIRFWNVDVFKHPNEVVNAIYGALPPLPALRATFPHRGGGRTVT